MTRNVFFWCGREDEKWRAGILFFTLLTLYFFTYFILYSWDQKEKDVHMTFTETLDDPAQKHIREISSEQRNRMKFEGNIKQIAVLGIHMKRIYTTTLKYSAHVILTKPIIQNSWNNVTHKKIYICNGTHEYNNTVWERFWWWYSYLNTRREKQTRELYNFKSKWYLEDQVIYLMPV